MSPSLRIAMFNTDTLVPTDLLVAAASRCVPDLTIECTEYDIQKFEYPPSLVDVDVILVTGSASSSCDADEWIRRLDDYVRDVYKNHRHSLLREYGVCVEKDPKGYELGVKEIRLHGGFRKTLANGSAFSREIPDSLRVQMIHADHVVIPNPEALPQNWMLVGATDHCAVQGIYEPARIFMLQGHFEFNRFVNMGILKVFGLKWDPQMLQDGLDAVDADDDAEFAAELVLQFMLEKDGAEDATHRKVTGLLSPPLG
ncbi:hypothetical protein BU23DRAFT_591759 [Bimuria novae-zelandiae CBS 107.79]|uniref:Class I glutamine amidotransferase-like protein n=1 Tax=Bimuria novae-zelandiae CBS 107.79 TaxID=1447943 RepID=A0A6A5V6V8_9PLEO|nr:hypothetical protein BU23DRAFT_591759 [Bimuria novae-zelandiae CBS 107.79]